MAHSTGYGPSTNRLYFDGVDSHYEQWEVKFLGYMRIQKLHATITGMVPRVQDGEGEEDDQELNALAYAQLIQFLDDRSLSLVMRDAADDGRRALQILRAHYKGAGPTQVIALYTELTSLTMSENETTTDYVLRAERAAAALRGAGEVVSDNLLIAMLVKGLPKAYSSFVAVITQGEKTLTQFKAALKGFEETEKSRSGTASGGNGDSVLKSNMKKTVGLCWNCNLKGHHARDCRKQKNGGAAQRQGGLYCNFCHMNNHNDSSCRKKKRGGEMARVSEAVEKPGEGDFFFKVMTAESDVPKTELSAELFLVDTGATTHIVNDESLFTSFSKNFNAEKHFIELANGERENVAKKKGSVKVKMRMDDGRMANVTLQNVLYVPSFPQNIFSVQVANQSGASVSFHPQESKIITPSGETFKLEEKGKLFYLKAYRENESAYFAQDIMGWHETLGHCNLEDVSHLEHTVRGMKIKGRDRKACPTCMMGKMCNDRKRVERVRAKEPMELIHTDLGGPIHPATKEGFKYCQVFVDDYSGTEFIYFLKNKSDTVTVTERFIADTAPYGKIKIMRMDNAAEFSSKEFKKLLTKNRIKQEFSAPYSPHQNGTAERNWRTIFEMARCMLIDAQLVKEMWPYAVFTATYIRNRCLNKRLDKTPYEALTGRKPDVGHMRPFGCECYALNQVGVTKLDPKSKKGKFVGYDRSSPAYLVYFPETGEVKRCRVVKFVLDKDDVHVQDDETLLKMKPKHVRNDVVDVDDHDVEKSDAKSRSSDDKSQCMSQGNKNAEEKAKVPQAQHEQDRGRPQRTKRPPAYLTDYETEFQEDHILSVDYCYMMHSIPKTYKEAMESDDSKAWKNAMDEEINSLKENDTFTHFFTRG